MVQRGKQVVFVLLSVADLSLTCWLLERSGGNVHEANPVAAWWLARYGAMGLACFKGAMVLLVLGLAAVIARHRPRAAGHILTFGCAALALVVLYSASLCPAASRTPAEREAIEIQQHNQKLSTMNRTTQQWRARMKAFLALRDELCQCLLAGRSTLHEAVDRLLATEQGRDARWRAGLSHLHPEGSLPERVAIYLILGVYHLAEGPDDAWRSVRRLERELEITYGRSLPQRLRVLLADAGVEESASWVGQATPTLSLSLSLPVANATNSVTGASRQHAILPNDGKVIGSNR
jgi:hypothetical protein